MSQKPKQKWWKKSKGLGQNIIKKSPPKNTNAASNSSTPLNYNEQKPNHRSYTSSSMDLPKLKNPSTLTETEINQIQNDLIRVTQQRNQLEHELNVRGKQLEQMEENLRAVSDQSKIIARMAMEKEQEMIELKDALQLQTKQLELFRTGGKSELNISTILPLHLRGKFSEFLRSVLLQQKQFFDKALNLFVNNKLSDDELMYGNDEMKKVDSKKIRELLINEISKIGLNLMKDYVMELELRLNGIFHQNDNNVNNNLNKMEQQMIKLEQDVKKEKNDDDKSIDLSDVANELKNEYNDDDDDDDDADPELAAMRKHMRQLTTRHLETTIKHGGDGSAEINKIFSSFAAFKKGIDRPSNAPTPFRVADKTKPFIELRDMLEALPYDLTKAIIQEQEINSNDRIRDVLLQRGCWPIIRFSSNRCKNLNHNVPFNDLLIKIETYLTSQDMKNSKNSSKQKEPGMYLLGILDPQHTTGYRLHQISAIIRQRNESKHMITALTIRVGRIWQEIEEEEDEDDNEDDDLVGDALDFFQSLQQPALMLLLGANTSEKSALCRELSKQISTQYNQRTALVDTRSGVAGYLESPLETGQTVRFYVNSITNQSNIIDQTRSIFPQCVIIDEVLSLNDIEVVSKLQSEGITCIVGTNMHSLKALIGHPVFSKLLPPQHRLHNDKIGNTMSPHLLILEMDYQGNNVKMYKNIPDAVTSIRKNLDPPSSNYKIKWNDNYVTQKHSNHASKTSPVNTNNLYTHQIMNSLSVSAGKK